MMTQAAMLRRRCSDANERLYDAHEAFNKLTPADDDDDASAAVYAELRAAEEAVERARNAFDSWYARESPTKDTEL